MHHRFAAPLAGAALAFLLLGAQADTPAGAPPIYVPADPVGTLAGTFGVDANGAATYEVPLEVPPGVDGLAPQLALTYNSQRGNGLLGVGWTLNGIESIARCGATEVSSGYIGSVTYGSADRFCLAGMPLMAVAGAYGGDGTEYRTARDTWTRIVSHGTCGKGPCYFTAHNKDGAELRFGYTAGPTGSRILVGGRDETVRVWSQDRYTDLNGNFVAVTYRNNAALGEYYPVRLAYGGNERTGVAPQRTVTFEYEVRSDRITAYAGTWPYQTLSRLAAIKTWVGSSLVKSYFVGYAIGSTRRSQLKSLRECSSTVPSDLTCLPPTTFELSSPSNGFSSGPAKIGPSLSRLASQLLMDIDGDGKTDFVDVQPLNGKLSLTTYRSTGREFGDGSSQDTGIVFGGLGIVGLDLDGDRRGDLVMPVEIDGALSLYTFLSQGESYGAGVESRTRRPPRALAYLPMDVGGDGLEDLVQVIESDGRVAFVIFHSSGNGRFEEAVTSGTAIPADNHGFFPLDANGDGAIDVVQVQQSDGAVRFIVYVSDGRAFGAGYPVSTGRNPSGFEVDAGDVNGDGLGDLLLLVDDGAQVEVTPFLSTGTVYFIGQRSTFLQGGRWNLGISAASLNGDDRCDLLQHLDSGDGRIIYQPHYGNGETFDAGPAFASEFGKAHTFPPRLMDLDGDGKQEILAMREEGDRLQLPLLLNTGGQPDLLERVVNGLGGEVIVSHLPMTDSRIYRRGSGAAYPVADIASSLPLVAAYSNLDGRGGRYDFSYRYEQARVGYEGRGWLGFRTVRMIQESNGRFSEVTYSQDYPRHGLVTRSSTHDRDEVLLGSTDFTYADVSSAALQALRVHQLVRTSETYSAYADNHGGARLYSLRKTYGYDSRANMSLISDLGHPEIAADDRFTCFRYQDDTARWRLGYVQQELVARTAARCRAFAAAADPAWDPATDVSWRRRAYDDRMNQTESAVWDDSNGVWVKATATFDDYGNQLTATDPAGNTTTFEYEPTYRTFLAQLTSPPNAQGEKLVESFGYEPFFGHQVLNLDANGNLFAWSVDTFGRMVDEYGPVPGGSPASPVRLRHTGFGRNGNGFYAQVSSRPSWEAGDDPAAWFWERTYSDGLEREWRTETRGPSDATATVKEIRFNGEGQASHTSLPYFANASPSFVVTTYDVYNRPVTVTQPDGTVQKFDYSQLGSLKVYVTDAFGTPDARTEIAQFDAYGQLTSRVLANGEVYKYQYGLLSELVQIDTLPERRQVRFTYDSLGRLRETTATDTGTNRFDWNAKGQMVGSRDADGNTVAYTYDALGRILTSTGTTASGSSAVRLTYDGSTSNGLGNLTRAELSQAPLGEYRYDLGYDPYKQTRSVQVALAGGSYAYGFDWNPLGQLAGETYPDGSRLTVGYRADANPSSFSLAGADGPAATLVTYDDYDANGVPLRTLFRNGVETTRSFYAADAATGKVKSIVASRGGATLFGDEYAWNRLDLVTSIENLAAGQGIETFGYDQDRLGFLTTAEGPSGSESFTYDKVGNRQSRNGVAYSYPAGSDRLTSYGPGTDLSWNANGSLKTLVNASGTFDFTYDAGGRVTGVAKAGVGQPGVFAYDFAGNRIFSQPIGSNTRVYGIAADYEIADYGNGKVLATKYIEGQYGRAVAITRPLASVTAAAAPFHHHRMRARLYQGGSGLAGALLPSWHGALALASSPAFVTALAFAVPALLALAGLAFSLGLAGRRGREATTRYARRRPIFAAATPLMAALLLISATSPVEAALSPGANGAGNPTEGILYFVQNLVQSTVLVTNEQGAVTASLGYMPFGAVDPAASQGVDDFRPKYTDKTFDAESGLYFFGERYYDPAVGRFTTPDPVAQYLNPYVLGADDPISQIDPNGDFALLAVIIVGAVIGAYLGAAAVNHSFNPAQWDWTSGKTYAGLLGGAIIGAVGGVIVEAAATVGVAAGIAGAVAVGAGENAAFTAMGGGSAKDLLIAAAEGAAFGLIFGGAAAAVGRLFRGGGAAASEAGSAGRAGRAGAEVAEGAAEGSESAVARTLRSSCSSFLPGEAVLTADGSSRAIETLAAGDRVVGYLQEKDASGAFPVAARLSGEASSIAEIVTASGARISATPNHPFRVAGMGWLPAAELHSGLSLVNPEGRAVALRSVEHLELPSPRSVYNVSVEDAESYYVSADRVLVKNVRASCLMAKGSRRPGWRSSVKESVFDRQKIASGAGKGQIQSAVSSARFARGHRVAVGSQGRRVTIWQLDHAKATYRDLLWAAGRSKKVVTWKNMIDISNYSPNLRYLTMAENVSHAFEPTTAQGRRAAVRILKQLGHW